MTDPLPFLTKHARGTLIQIYVQPRASRTKIAGVFDGALKIAVQAPPVDGEANSAVIEWFADFLKIPKQAIALVKGEKGRRKTVLIAKKLPEEIARLIGDALK